jgi:hypothetical protein
MIVAQKPIMFPTVNADVPAILQPLYQHLQTVCRQFLSESSGFSIVVTEIRRSMVFTDPTPEKLVE